MNDYGEKIILIITISSAATICTLRFAYYQNIHDFWHYVRNERRLVNLNSLVLSHEYIFSSNSSYHN